MTNILITKGKSRTISFTIYGTDGVTPDTTTVIDAAHLAMAGTDGAVSIVPSATSAPSRTVRLDAVGPGIGADRFQAIVTARGRTGSTPLVDVVAPPDLSSVVFDVATVSAEFDTPTS